MLLRKTKKKLIGYINVFFLSKIQVLISPAGTIMVELFTDRKKVFCGFYLTHYSSYGKLGMFNYYQHYVWTQFLLHYFIFLEEEFYEDDRKILK